MHPLRTHLLLVGGTVLALLFSHSQECRERLARELALLRDDLRALAAAARAEWSRLAAEWIREARAIAHGFRADFGGVPAELARLYREALASF